MFVEDILRLLCYLVVDNTIKGAWHRDFISSVQNHVDAGSAVSTNQSQMILKIADGYKSELAKKQGCQITEITKAIQLPNHRKPPYASTNVKREVRYIGGGQLAFRYKADAVVTQALKGLYSPGDPKSARAKWNHRFRLWIVSVTPTNVEPLMSLISLYAFDFDQETLEYFTLCSNSLNAKPTMFLYEEERTIYGNIPNNPELQYLTTVVMGGEII